MLDPGTGGVKRVREVMMDVAARWSPRKADVAHDDEEVVPTQARKRDILVDARRGFRENVW